MFGFSCRLRHNEMDIMGHPPEFAEYDVNHFRFQLAVVAHIAAPMSNDNSIYRIVRELLSELVFLKS